jgi:CRISPR/Cas system-associated endonuclease/helicase Cas3
MFWLTWPSINPQLLLEEVHKVQFLELLVEAMRIADLSIVVISATLRAMIKSMMKAERLSNIIVKAF